MSSAAKLTLAGTTLGAIGIVYFVHWSQTVEKDVRSSFRLCTPPANPGRRCMLALSGTWNNNDWNENDSLISKCRGSSSKSIERFKMCQNPNRSREQFPQNDGYTIRTDTESLPFGEDLLLHIPYETERSWYVWCWIQGMIHHRGHRNIQFKTKRRWYWTQAGRSWSSLCSW